MSTTPSTTSAATNPLHAPPGPAARALRHLYLTLATLHLDAAIALASAVAAHATSHTPASLTAATIAALPAFAAETHARELLSTLRDLIAYGPGPDPVAALLATADYHARALTTARPDMRAHHASSEQLNRELAALVREALAAAPEHAPPAPAETLAECCGEIGGTAITSDTTGRMWTRPAQCTLPAGHGGPHVAHRRDGTVIATWDATPEGSAGR